MTIRVLVADDQAMIRGALAGLLNLERDIEVVAQAADGVQALEELTRLATQAAPRGAIPTSSEHPFSPVDVAIVDIEMPHMDGITTTEAIRARFAHLQRAVAQSIRVLQSKHSQPVRHH